MRFSSVPHPLLQRLHRSSRATHHLHLRQRSSSCCHAPSLMLQMLLPGAACGRNRSYKRPRPVLHPPMPGAASGRRRSCKSVPLELRKLRKLMHLDLSGCSSLENISKFLGNLTAVQYLNLSECACIGDLPASLGSLSELQYLNLSFSSYVRGSREAQVLGALTKLEYLNLSSKDYLSLQKLPEGLTNFVNLKYLIWSGSGMKELPRLFGNLRGSVHLDLSMCKRVDFLLEAFDGLTNLQYLNLSGSLNVYHFEKHEKDEIIIDRISTLSNLEHLDLSRNCGVHSLPESLGNLRKLQTLDISHTEVREIPASIGTIDSLKMLLYSGCCMLIVPQFCYSSIALPNFVVHAGDGESSSNLVLLRDTNPDELNISRLENVKSVEEAEHIKLMEKGRLTVLQTAMDKRCREVCG